MSRGVSGTAAVKTVKPTVNMPSAKVAKMPPVKIAKLPAAKLAADPLVKSKLAKAPPNLNKSPKGSSKLGNTSILPKNGGML